MPYPIYSYGNAYQPPVPNPAWTYPQNNMYDPRRMAQPAANYPMAAPGQQFMPASQALPTAPPGLNITPQQMAMMKSQLPPEMQGEFDKWFADPQTQARLAQVQTLAQQGKLSPEAMAQMMGGGQAGAKSENPIDPQDKMKGLMFALALGLPLGMGMDYVSSGLRKGTLDGFLRLFDKAPILNNLSKQLNTRIEEHIKNGTVAQSTLARIDNNLTSEVLRKEALQTMLGPKGYAKELNRILSQFPGAKQLLPQIQKAKSTEALQFILAKLQTQSDKTLLAGELKKLFGRFTNGVHSIETVLPAIDSEHALMATLKNRQIGPIGRGLARFIDSFNQIFSFSGKAFGQRMEFLGPFNRLMGPLLSTGMLTTAMTAYFNQNAPKESRLARVSEETIESIIAALAFFAGSQALTKTGMFYRSFPQIAKWLDKPFLYFFSRKGAIMGIVVPAILMHIGKRVSHLIFGNPDKIEARAKAKAQDHPLEAKQGLFQQLTQPGKPDLPQIPGVTPDTPAFVDTKAPIDQRMSLSPDMIAKSPFDNQAKPAPAPRLTRADQYKMLDMWYPAQPT